MEVSGGGKGNRCGVGLGIHWDGEFREWRHLYRRQRIEFRVPEAAGAFAVMDHVQGGVLWAAPVKEFGVVGIERVPFPLKPGRAWKPGA